MGREWKCKFYYNLLSQWKYRCSRWRINGMEKNGNFSQICQWSRISKWCCQQYRDEKKYCQQNYNIAFWFIRLHLFVWFNSCVTICLRWAWSLVSFICSSNNKPCSSPVVTLNVSSVSAESFHFLVFLSFRVTHLLQSPSSVMLVCRWAHLRPQYWLH
jgi:hypothetical protein